MSSAKEVPGVPRPSSSILLVSPTNTVLLLHRVQTSSSFPSAHVFPGGNLSSNQDGPVPDVHDPGRHRDSRVYRVGAIRECFEESGILLVKNRTGQLLEVEESVRQDGRRAVHSNKVNFQTWVEQQGGYLDLDGLVPFTRWITPTAQPKRFTTQMYLYFLPLSTQNGGAPGMHATENEAMIPPPTHDGGREHTAARFQPVQDWVSQARSGEIILFPPQFLLIHLLSRFFAAGTTDNATLQRQRDEVRAFVRTGTPPWTDKCISPVPLMQLGDGRVVLSLEKPGPELEGSDRRGESELVVATQFKKEGPRRLEVMTRSSVFAEAKQEKRAAQKGLKL